MKTAPELAGQFLIEVADRLGLPGDRERKSILATMDRACGGQLDAYGPDGRRASTLTASGTPLEVSISGGNGELSPAVRFVTEASTQTIDFADRLTDQLEAVQDLVAWLPHGDQSIVHMLTSFVSTLYPDPAAVSKRFRSPIWSGVVHHAAVPGRIARLKVYGGLRTLPGALARLQNTWPGFSGLGSLPEKEDLFVPVGAALEVDARGDVTHKVYLKTRYKDVAVPMRLVRCFGDVAWEVISEFARAGVDPATLYRHQYFVCCSHGVGGQDVGITLMRSRHEDLTQLAGALAAEHHGSTAGPDALVGAAVATGTNWLYSGIGLGFSETTGIGKLNVYGAPTWGPSGIVEPPVRSRVQERARQKREPATGRAVDVGHSATTVPAIGEKGLCEAIDAACRFLVDRQDSDGHWRDYELRPGRSESWITGCVGFALNSATEVIRPTEVRAQAVDRAVAALQDCRRPRGWGYHRKGACDADSTSWVVRLLATRGPQSDIPVEIFTPYLTSTGGVRTFSTSRTYGTWADEHDEVAPIAGLALDTLGADGMVATIRSRVVHRHRQHGTWQRFWWRSVAYATAHNLTFLARTGGIPPDIEEIERERAADSGALTDSRSRLGRSSFDTAQQLISAVRLGVCGSVERLAGALLGAQLSDGGWPSSRELMVPGRWDTSAAVFADDRRLLTTAMSISALSEVVRVLRGAVM